MNKKLLVFFGMVIILGLSGYVHNYIPGINIYVKHLLTLLDMLLISFIATFFIGYILRFWESLEEPGYKTKFLRLNSPNLQKPSNQPKQIKPYVRSPRRPNKSEKSDGEIKNK